MLVKSNDFFSWFFKISLAGGEILEKRLMQCVGIFSLRNILVFRYIFIYSQSIFKSYAKVLRITAKKKEVGIKSTLNSLLLTLQIDMRVKFYSKKIQLFLHSLNINTFFSPLKERLSPLKIC